MNREATTIRVHEIMANFAALTGLDPVSPRPKRYLWTDAFAVCNYLELFDRTGDEAYRALAMQLVDQVHHTLGRHRDDDARTGWISGLSENEGGMHPTRGGLRIGKPGNERGATEAYDERKEWDQDGQYFHYLTKWMHALHQMSRVTGEQKYLRWAIELAEIAHARFTYSNSGGRKRMYWKMSIDLTRPLVTSMGQHDPLDGFVTFNELAFAPKTQLQKFPPALGSAIKDMADMCREMNPETNDSLGIGGLLFDVSRLGQMATRGGPEFMELIGSLIVAAVGSLKSFDRTGTLSAPAEYRLAFRELGLAIGIAGIDRLSDWNRKVMTHTKNNSQANPQILKNADRLHGYIPFRSTINEFWLDPPNQLACTWREHREINMVMLATSLAPDGFLRI